MLLLVIKTNGGDQKGRQTDKLKTWEAKMNIRNTNKDSVLWPQKSEVPYHFLYIKS